MSACQPSKRARARASPYVFLLTPGAVPANAPGLLHIVLKSAGPGPAASRSAGPPAPSRPVFSIVRLGARGPILVEMAPPAAGSWDFRLGASEMAASRLAAREGRRPGWHFQLELPGGGPQPVQLIPTIAHDRDLRLPGQLDAPPKDSSPPRPAGGAASSIGGRSSAGGSPSAPESPVSPAALLVASAVEAALGRSSSSGAASLVLERPMGGAASTSRLAERPPTPPEKEPGCPAREEAAAAASPVAPFPSLGAINLATRAAMAQGFGLSEAQLNPLKCGARAAGGGPDSTASSAGLPPCTPPPRLNAAEQSLALAGHWALRDLRLLVGELRGAARGREPWQPSPHWQPLPGATHPDLRMFIRNPALMPALRRSPPAKNPSRFVAGLVDLPGVRPEDVAAAIDTLSARQVWDPMVDDYKRLDRAFTATGAVDLVHVRLKPVAKIERDLVFVGCSYQPPNEPNTLYCVSRSIQATDASTLPTAGQAAGSPELLADPSADDLRQHPSLPKDARTLSCVYLGGWRLELLSDPGAPPVTRAVHIMCNDPCAWVPAMVINRITNALPKKVGELAHFLAAQGAPPGCA
ncbi:hypothetical protein H696_04840 [Fonticula alba]|uniref:START domain-containing protein n=1 Tax=Fonticula alba TaxID=691883 RepID=A0A058Z3S0_FONAL|nr:hypothetical protein H696_04840 [Fonticula alba]KCV68548.1 hypothetical protein H696_04840 [Fonticula alba]|eukprot:XP_009496980.1 hypothetical protein H696_04840 [Fonticula alba]